MSYPLPWRVEIAAIGPNRWSVYDANNDRILGWDRELCHRIALAVTHHDALVRCCKEHVAFLKQAQNNNYEESGEYFEQCLRRAMVVLNALGEVS